MATAKTPAKKTPAKTADKAQKARATQVAEAVIASEEAKKPKGPQLPMVYRDGTHSAIVLEIGAKSVSLITMASLKVEEMRIHEFEASFEPYPEYPVTRCAEIYLNSGQYRIIDEQTRERLLSITGGKLPANIKTFAQQPKDIEMPSQKAPAHPLRRASDAPIREALKTAGVTAPSTDKPTAAGAGAKTAATKPAAKPAATKPADKPASAKKAAESKEAKAPAVPAKKAASEKPTAKTAPAAKKAPWDAKKDGAKAEAKPAAKTPPTRAPKFGPDTKCKMGDTGKAKRGKMLVYIEKAIELAKKGRGQTTRGAIDSALAGSWEGDDLNTYFPYAVKNGLLVEA